ncbi:MAG: rod shape-determining protein RodA [Candidatus Rokubacteria bacterium RIFCSPHIGHO2_12_FULL_73_22]|nr:MAG: rod shape-determining protein RodA [Candidatus Rokubacteria bacterium RIFCSPHIGHO2_02_FULL_73_26]OGL02122.1 MAG: rod shape-determining protein RodA [Candidatus Rokubacteria bacterium RIFCSPHIGHO2_12_FULL_73_22]OGL08053.1 MAG: rod shape-determining protein RodA [Candidatus Rokubacteria bacterium RIFCSPLOWO2_02_FULL_73_56]OGL29009.1 MAG: rod shape-determining protein RodA [Candidatus Rokubacteria bacterium RIFCSPLOWO2_12_FULL_73_47]
MVGIDRRLLENVDWALLGAAGALVLTSAVTLANLNVGRTGGAAVRQLVWFGVGLVALVVIASIDYRRLVRAAPALYLLGLAGLGAVFVLGRTVSGARRWIVWGPLSVQPSEIFKICFVLMAVWVITSRWAQPVGRTAVALTLPIVAVPALLIVKQPDLGTAVMLFPVLVILLVGAGMRLRLLGGLALAGVAAAPLAWLVLRDYQRERILVFLDPLRDPLGSAYNVIQAKIAIGSGQLLGKGVAGATQSRLAFLPERHTDFIFAVFAETWGFVGCLVLLVCYVLLLLRGFDIAASAREPVGRLVALGATSLLATQVLINVGMVTGLLPVVGIPLPLMSYGGSSMLASLMALGLLLSVRMRQFQ